ncbi:hypothetical protein [Flammeovirga pectinis]|nr:hypothetical protein [Flammeovirga pectinis]
MKKLKTKQMKKVRGGLIHESCIDIIEHLFNTGHDDQAWGIIKSDVYYVC